MTERERFPDRRPSITQRVTYLTTGGKEISFLVTFSFYSKNDRRVREFFCADFKAGTDNHAMIVDASILVSRLLQHGTSPAMLLASLTEPRSFLGCILEAASKLETELERNGNV